MHLVLDTNTVVAGLLWYGPPRLLLNLARNQRVTLSVSMPLLLELDDVLHRPKFAVRLELASVLADELVLGYAALCRHVIPQEIPSVVLDDPNDDDVLACALAAGADVIVSGDHHLLDLGAYKEIRIPVPGEPNLRWRMHRGSIVLLYALASRPASMVVWALDVSHQQEYAVAGFFQTELQIVEILIVVSLVAIAVRRVRLPYTVALVLAGLALAFQGQVELTLTPELVLGLFVPPLVFEAAFHLQFRDLRNEIGPILAMAVPGVLVSTAAVGGILVLTGVLPLPVALLFGALISATDPVAVVATFRSVGAPQRLLTLVEGESLFNDGTAVVIFNIVLALVLGGILDPVQGVSDFVFVSAGGILIGALLGYGISKLIAQIDDYLIEITLTTILAYGSYLLAEEFHVSGVLAVVLAGLVNGNLGPRGMSPTTRIVLFNFWEYIAFLANSFVFLLIGVSVKYDQMLAFFTPGLIAIGAVLVARGVAIAVLGAGVRLFRRDMPGSYLPVMAWGGLRGAISLALVISLPAALAERGQLLAMTFAVVLFTLLVQAMSMPSLLARLGLSGRRSQPVQYERLQGQLLAVRSAVRYLDRLYREGALLPTVYTTVNDELKTRQETLNGQMEELLSAQPELRAQVLSLARQEVLRAERAALDELIHEGLLSTEALADLQAELDEKIGLAGHA